MNPFFSLQCRDAPQEYIDALDNMNTSQIEEAVTDHLVGELGVSYMPLVDGAVNYWSNLNYTREEGWTGYTINEETEKFEIRGLAMGMCTFVYILRLYLDCIFSFIC